jgi:hypothetical protein
MKFRIVAAVFFFPILAFGQEVADRATSTSKVEFYLARYSLADSNPSSLHQVVSFVDKLDSKRPAFKRESDFIEYVFVKTHQRFLKHYAEYPSFGQMLNTGTYNCLTATALYALLLDHFEIEYEMIETNYHIFLQAHTAEGNILMESTDPTHGIVTDEKEIKKRIAQYRDEGTGGNTSGADYQYSFNLYNTVNLDQMLGLLHYNRSIAAYNEQQFSTSVAELAKAIESYHSPRIQAFSELVLFAVLSSDLDSTTKEKCLHRLDAIRKLHYDISASANRR